MARHRFHILTILLVSLFPSSAAAQPCTGVPSPVKSVVPGRINLVGQTAGVKDPVGAFTIIVNDCNSLPICNAYVSVDFSNCSGDVFPADQPGYSCATLTATTITACDGKATFNLSGATLHRSLANQTHGACALVSADGVLLGTMSVGTFDLNGVDGVGSDDIWLWMCDSFLGLPRANYEGNAPNPVDLSILLGRRCFDAALESAPHCDGQPTASDITVVPGLDLAWNDCVAGGAATTHNNWSCASNNGTTSWLYGSIVAPAGVVSVTSFEAILDVTTLGGEPLPDWWDPDCRHAQPCPPSIFGCSGFAPAELEGIFDSSCDPSLGTDAKLGYWYQYQGEPDHARFWVFGQTDGTPIELTEGVSYALFRLRFHRNKTVGAGACTGCDVPIDMTLSKVVLMQSDGNCQIPAVPTRALNSVLPIFSFESPGTSNVVFAQTEPVGVGDRVPDSGLALWNGAANPSHGVLQVRLTLADASPATLELMDVMGRTIERKSLGSLGPGTHTVEVGASRHLTPGMYNVRLTQGRRSTYLKVSVVK